MFLGERKMEIDYWAKWMRADGFERIEMVKDLMICKNFAEAYYPKMSKETAMHMVATLLNSYFEDLYESSQELKKWN